MNAELCDLMYFAFVEIRALLRSGKAEQAEKLADVFHNLPKDIGKGSFSIHRFLMSLDDYQSKYGIMSCDYAARVRSAIDNNA